jgi:hypothetical protein
MADKKLTLQGFTRKTGSGVRDQGVVKPFPPILSIVRAGREMICKPPFDFAQGRLCGGAKRSLFARKGFEVSQV